MLLTNTCRISFFIIHSKYYCFWLAKITCTIFHASHHNQLMLTKFERILSYRTDVVKTAAKLQIIEPFNEKTWGRVWVVFEVSKGRTLYSPHSKLLSKNIHCKGTARRQLDRRHLLFGVYLQTWTARATKVMPCWAGLEDGRVSDQSIISHQLVCPFFVSLFPCTISFFNAYSKAYLLPGNFWHHPSLLFGLVLSANHQCQTATFIVIFRTNPNCRMSIKNANYIIFADFFTQTMILIKLFKLDLSSINIWIE